MSQYISKALRQKVAEYFHFRCAYCQTAQEVVGPILEIDHIIPQSQGGPHTELNLCLACPICNGHKSDQTSGLDPETQQILPLFQPRQQRWTDHFAWDESGSLILAKTAIGRATIATLKLNQPQMITVRLLWVEAGWHPPDDD